MNAFLKTPNPKYAYNILLVKNACGKHGPSSYTQETYRIYRSGDTEHPTALKNTCHPGKPCDKLRGYPLPVGFPSVSGLGKRF